ncbi:MAG: Hsp70 family protein [Desulfobacterales bacterium]
MEPIVGIDLGTTNSEIAFIIDRNAEVLTDQDDGIMPSCVSIDENGDIKVGTEAKNQAILKPENTVMSIKRRMGDDTPVALGPETYLPQEISAIILKALKARAEKILDQAVHKAVITVPAYFTDDQRQATREAGQIAGLEVTRIINEPTAAALAYENASKKTESILVYDLGGGTFDVSIVKIENSVVEVLASTGDNHLGGDDFDQRVAERLADHIQETHNLTLRDDPLVMHRLKRAAENAKIALSHAPYAMIEEDHITTTGDTPVHLSYELSRQEFEAMVEADLSRTMDAVSRALDDAGILPASLDQIILVGGSTRIPAITRFLEEKTGILPRSEIDPDLCVAIGAAIQAGREMGMTDAGVLIDITPYTFGTSAIGELYGEMSPDKYVPLIRRNTKLPASKSDVFFTLHDNQDAVEINVFQGEAPDARENVNIGTYFFELTPAPANSEIIMRFDLDLNGILQIEAVEKATGRKINAVIENAISRFSEDDLAAAGERINQLWGSTSAAGNTGSEADGAPASHMPSDLADLLRRAGAMLEDAPAEDRDEIINLIEDIRTAADEDRIEDARAAGEELEDILFYLE